MTRPLPRVGRYELRGELGRGGVGAVYRAFDPSSGEEVAVKVLLAAARLSPEDLARFRVEAAAGQRLRHPGIVAVRDAGAADGVPFIVMDLVAGGSLRQRLSVGALPPVEAARLVERLARALSHAHAQGVLHRDIKPGNILLDARGAPLLTDFGMAQLVGAERLTHTGDVLGTPHYMAPEQAAGDRGQHGPWTDVYALGVTLYELLTGRLPFGGDSALAVIEAVLRSEPPRPSAVRPGLDPALEEICLRAMARTPARRYVTAEALAAALATWLDAPPTPTRAGRRRGRVAGGLGVAALAVAAVAGVAVLGRGPGVLDSVDAVAPATTGTATTGTATSDPRGELTLRVDELLVQAASQALEDDPRGAVEHLTRAVALDPTCAAAYAHRSVMRGRLDDLEGSLADAERAIELAPELALAHKARATVALVVGDLARADAEYTRVLELDPRDGDAWIERALARGTQRPRERALEDLRRALDVPLDVYTLADVHALMAKFLWADGRGEEALGEVDLALALDPGARAALEVRAAHRLAHDPRGALDDAARADALLATAETAYVMGQARVALGDLAGRADLQRALRLARDEQQRALALAALERVSLQVVEQVGGRAGRDPMEALTACNQLLQADPGFEELRHLRAKLRVHTGDLTGALADLDQLVAAGGAGVVTALLDRALTRVMAGDVRGGVADADRAVELRPEEAGVWRTRGRVRGEANDHAGALADLDHALALRDDASSRLWRGALRVGQRVDVAGGLDDLERAERAGLSPSDQGTARIFRCLALLALGRLAEARDASERALREAPAGASGVWSMRSEVLLQLRRAEEAVIAADRAIELEPREAMHRLRRAAAHLAAHDITRARADITAGLGAAGDGFVGARLRRLQARADAFIAASAALRRDDIAAARAIMDDLVEHSSDVDDQVVHANFLTRIGDLAGAREAVDRALALAPHDLHARALHAELAPPEEGLADLTYILGISPDDLELRLHRADLLGRLGRVQDARADLERAAAAPAPTTYSLLFRARARLHVGDVRGARSDLDAAIARAPDLAQARLERAHLARFYAPQVAVADLEHLGRLVRSGETWEAGQRELALARRALDGGPVAPCDWPHLHPETTPR